MHLKNLKKNFTGKVLWYIAYKHVHVENGEHFKLFSVLNWNQDI